MVAPPSPLELSLLKKSSLDAEKESLVQSEKKRQLLAANKQKARILLLGISTVGYISAPKIENYNGK